MLAAGCMERKTVVFLPLVVTSQKFARILNDKGFAAREVNGESKDRTEVLNWFDKLVLDLSYATRCCLQKAGTAQAWIALWYCAQPKYVVSIVRWWGVALAYRPKQARLNC